LPANRESRRLPGVLGSIGGHAACLALLVLALHIHSPRPVLPQSRCCSVALVWTGTADSAPAVPVRRRAPAARPHPATRRAPSPARVSSQNIVATPQPASLAGTGMGDQDAEPAFPVYYPQPGITDRSLLPATEQKIIVDVSVGPQGDVLSEKLVHGLGNSLDQAVLSVVRTWRFQAATLNGSPVASEQELIFPFSRNTPSTPS